MSPWTDALFHEQYSRTMWEYYQYHPQASKYTRYEKSKVWDEKIYDEIIKILTPPEPEKPSKLATQLEQWKEHNSKGRGK